jgi:hypothetical protein
MIEPRSGNLLALIRIVRNPSSAYLNGTLLGAAPADADALDVSFMAGGGDLLKSLYITDNNFDLSISTQEVILSMQQLMHRLGELAADVNLYLNGGSPEANNANFFEYPYNGVADDTEHLKFEIGTDGRLRIIGSRPFWGCFSIEVPSVQDQYGFYGVKKSEDDTLSYTQLRRFMSVNPETGLVSYSKIIANRFLKTVPVADGTNAIARGAAIAYNSRTVLGSEPHVKVVSTTFVTPNYHASFAASGTAGSTETHAIRTRASLFSTLERRIALEVGCSLPIKNSPMVDHQRESPDFVIGRWIWKMDPRIESNDVGGSRRYHSNMPSCTEYQGAQDRITYHELQAQAKIQTFRIRLFARLRTFNDETEEWGMRVIQLPTSSTDWWHTRIHFISKD